MANLMTSFYTGVSGLHSAQASLNTTSHNLANAQTKGYVRQQVLLTDAFYVKSIGPSDNVMMTGKGTVIQQTRQIRNEFLDYQYRMQNGRLGFYDKNKETAIEIQDMLGELNGEQFQTAITDLKGALASLAGDPGNIVYKDQVVSIASEFAERAKVLQDDLNNYQTSLDVEIKQEVDEINEIVYKIKNLNKNIQKYEATGETANDYRDQRNKLLDDLSKIIDFETNEERDGTITIFAQGQFLLDTTNQYRLTTVAIGKYDKNGQEWAVDDPDNRDAGSTLLKVKWENGGDYFTKDELIYNSADHTDVGSLRGLMVSRGGHAANYTDNNVGEKPELKEYLADPKYTTQTDAIDAYNLATKEYTERLEEYNKYIDPSIVMTLQVQLDTLVHGIVTMINDTLSPLTYATESNTMYPDGAGTVNGTPIALYNKNGSAATTKMTDGNGKELNRVAGTLTDSLGNPVRILDYEHAFIGDDKNNTAGTELFSRRGMERFTKTDQYYMGTDGNFYPVWIYNEEITEAPTMDHKGEATETITMQVNGENKTFVKSDFPDATTGITWDNMLAVWQYQKDNCNKSLYTIGQLTMNPEILQDSSRIPTKFQENSPQRGGYNNETILEVVKNFENSMGTLDPNSQTEYDVDHYYAGIIGNLATVSNVWNGIVENQELTVHSVDNERLDVMGVSSDEELSDLIKFQRCYDASSRYITVVDEMLQHLIERLGA
ncbi:MAG: flagellar hook-associated protein FlgK [Eubacterium sp.]|nr:flagellar hook-associated protein FlgK [Eubacterium sp.]